MISIEGLSVAFGGNTLFDNITYVINKKDRIALVGKNGAGKSTMLKIIAGLQAPTSGSVNMPKDLTVGYLPQQMNLSDTRTVMEEAEQAFSHIFELQSRIERMNTELSERTDYESEYYQELIERVSNANEQLALIGASNYQAEIEKTLIGLGFTREDFGRDTSEFSGGWRMRIELAKLLLQRPDVLLLDEPTNHLDIESIQWLESFLSTRANAVVLVSHDRAFIDNVTTRTIEISLGRIYDYQVNYSRYVVLRQERLEQQMRAYENQQKQIQDTEAFIERFRYKATKSVQVQSRIKQLAKLERVEVDEVDTSRLNLKFPPAPRSGDYPIIAEGVGKNYGSHVVFSNATFTIKRGEKVAFVGKNGEGKSTLVKCIMGEIPYTGTLKIGHNVKIGYFAQNQASLLDESITVFDTIDRVAVGDIRTKIRDILGAFMFGGEASDKKVKVLSGGEKTRLAMIRLLLEPVNLLILDEPTNHLDMRTKDVLKQAIRDFNGTVILVSHDREFLDGLVSKVYEFGGGQVREHLGGIYDFLESRKLDSLRELEQRATVSKTEKDGNISKDSASSAKSEDSKLSYGEQKEFARRLRKAEKVVADIESEIAGLEKRIAEVEEKLATPDGAADTSLYELHGQLKKQLDDVMWKWFEASEVLDKLQK
ncbi:ABC-F family ATP-binding cassette domain-containing protein [Barnesiella intestinihominis]|jgi:putative ABC transporter, ATP-binding protein|uniref:ABC-F family ATP-binding cassette domain-containing protein n=1 Tax=Barnesiella intestinihominis TaxID=487174 RepID=UPI001D366828|nr:ABC-F family ATP-binding cassette domain-containing protein [Barnesiella intestinihominis]HJF96060.1 ABC-F family ATP-binding cassette domain-containing protein [Barnesiella intestinihominis]